ncbi:MAG: hypothetical protein V4714_18585 [Bacteroidota bacterium]
MASISQEDVYVNSDHSNQLAYLKKEAAAKLFAIRCEMTIRNFKSAQQFIHEHSQLVSQIKQLKEELIFVA